MRKFAQVINDPEKLQTVSALLSWSPQNNVDKLKANSEYCYWKILTSDTMLLTAKRIIG